MSAREHHLARVKARQARLRADGTCTKCGKCPAIERGRPFCAKCSSSARESQQLHAVRKDPNAARCLNCDGRYDGHIVGSLKCSRGAATVFKSRSVS